MNEICEEINRTIVVILVLFLFPIFLFLNHEDQQNKAAMYDMMAEAVAEIRASGGVDAVTIGSYSLRDCDALGGTRYPNEVPGYGGIAIRGYSCTKQYSSEQVISIIYGKQHALL